MQQTTRDSPHGAEKAELGAFLTALGHGVSLSARCGGPGLGVPLPGVGGRPGVPLEGSAPRTPTSRLLPTLSARGGSQGEQPGACARGRRAPPRAAPAPPPLPGPPRGGPAARGPKSRGATARPAPPGARQRRDTGRRRRGPRSCWPLCGAPAAPARACAAAPATWPRRQPPTPRVSGRGRAGAPRGSQMHSFPGAPARGLAAPGPGRRRPGTVGSQDPARLPRAGRLRRPGDTLGLRTAGRAGP